MNQEARLVRDLDLALRKKSRKEAREKWKKAVGLDDETEDRTKRAVGLDDGTEDRTQSCMGEADERCCAVAAGKCNVWPGACRVCRNTTPSDGATTCDACQRMLFPEHMLLLKPVSYEDVSLETLQESNRKLGERMDQHTRDVSDMSETIEALKESSRTAHEKAQKEVMLKMDAIMKRLDEQSDGGRSQGAMTPHKGESDSANSLGSK